MGIGDRLSDMADDTVHKAGGSEKAKEQLSKAADKAKSAAGGKYGEQIDKGEAGAKSAVDKLAKKNKRK